MQAAMTQHQQLTQFASEEHLAGEKKEAAEFVSKTTMTSEICSNSKLTPLRRDPCLLTAKL